MNDSSPLLPAFSFVFHHGLNVLAVQKRNGEQENEINGSKGKSQLTYNSAKWND